MEFFITHAHIDYIGRLPLALEAGFFGKIYLTKATAAICEVMLQDQLSIQGWEYQRIYKLLQEFNKRQYIIDRDGDFIFEKTYLPLSEDFQFTILRSSHILGSCSFVFRWTEDEYPQSCDNRQKRWLYLYHTGDLGPTSKQSAPGCLFKKAHFPFDSEDDKFFIMESTYGDRKRESQYSQHANRLDKLEKIVNNAIDTVSMLVIPAFSLDRPQQIQIDLKYLLEKNRLHTIPPFTNSIRVIEKRSLRKETLDEVSLDIHHIFPKVWCQNQNLPIWSIVHFYVKTCSYPFHNVRGRCCTPPPLESQV